MQEGTSNSLQIGTKIYFIKMFWQCTAYWVGFVARLQRKWMIKLVIMKLYSCDPVSLDLTNFNVKFFIWALPPKSRSVQSCGQGLTRKLPLQNRFYNQSVSQAQIVKNLFKNVPHIIPYSIVKCRMKTVLTTTILQSKRRSQSKPLAPAPAQKSSAPLHRVSTQDISSAYFR